MSSLAITEARSKLASVVDDARREPVYLTRRNRPVVAVVDAEMFAQMVADLDELDDIRAVDAAWDETHRLGETPIPWQDAKRDLGLA